MSFLNPTYLWALLGLAIPIAIHLWSKKEGKTIKIGSIKLLSEEDSKQSSSINLNELLLLFFRLSIITLVVMLMAEPQFKKENTNISITYIIESSLIANNTINAIIDSLPEDSSIKLLQKEFPELNEDIKNLSNSTTPNYWQLAKDMEQLKTDSIVVFTNAFSKGLKGKRPSINKNIEWIIIDTSKHEESIVEITKKEESYQLLSLISNQNRLSFKKENLPSTRLKLNVSKDSVQINSDKKENWFKLKTENRKNILLYYDNQYSNQSKYIEAGINAISKYLNQPFEITKTKDVSGLNFSTFDNIVWLSDASLPKQNSKTLSYKPNVFAKDIIVDGDTENQFYLTKSLNSESIIDYQLTEHLLVWLQSNSDLEEITNSKDKRIVSKAELLPIYKNEKTTGTFIETISITKWLLLLLALLLITERIIAHTRKQ